MMSLAQLKLVRGRTLTGLALLLLAGCGPPARFPAEPTPATQVPPTPGVPATVDHARSAAQFETQAATQAPLAQAEPRTVVLFEAPHRIAAALADLSHLFGPERRAVVARELTKLHEAVYRGSLGELAAAALSDPNMARGEITLLIEGVGESAEAGTDRALLVRTLRLLLPEMPPGRAAALAAQIAGVKRSEAYALAQQLRSLDVVEGES